MEKEDFFERYRKLGEEPKEISLQQVIRINILKISAEELIERLQKKGVQLKKVDYLEQGYAVLESPFSLGACVEYLLGYFYLQEAASQLAVQVLRPKRDEKILDMAAAPGGKTTHIGIIMENKGVIIACDKGKRIEKLKNNLERLGIHNTLAYKKDVRFVKDFEIEFDKILLDAPCSGNFAIDEDWFEKRTMEDIQENVQLQKELLEAGVGVLKHGGELMYSTCSLEPEENEMIIDFALKNFDVELVEIDCIGDEGLTDVFGEKLDSEIKKCRRLWPWKTNTQGFFIAILRKC